MLLLLILALKTIPLLGADVYCRNKVILEQKQFFLEISHLLASQLWTCIGDIIASLSNFLTAFGQGLCGFGQLL